MNGDYVEVKVELTFWARRRESEDSFPPPNMPVDLVEAADIVERVSRSLTITPPEGVLLRATRILDVNTVS